MATLYRSVEESIARFRSGFKSLGIPEHDVKVTWDLEQRWARMRVRLPSGRILNTLEHPAEGESVEVTPGDAGMSAGEESKGLLRSAAEAYVEEELKKHYDPAFFDGFKAARWDKVMDRIEKSIIIPAELGAEPLSVESARRAAEQSTIMSWVRPIFEKHRLEAEGKDEHNFESES